MSKEAHKDLYDSGMKVRRQLFGDEFVNQRLAQSSSEFAKPMQEYVTESCFESIWNRPGLQWKERSMINLAMLAVMNRAPELALHVRVAVRNGVTEKEISEVLLQASGYGGAPAGIEAFKVSQKVFEEMNSNGEMK